MKYEVNITNNKKIKYVHKFISLNYTIVGVRSVFMCTIWTKSSISHRELDYIVFRTTRGKAEWPNSETSDVLYEKDV